MFCCTFNVFYDSPISRAHQTASDFPFTVRLWIVNVLLRLSDRDSIFRPVIVDSPSEVPEPSPLCALIRIPMIPVLNSLFRVFVSPSQNDTYDINSQLMMPFSHLTSLTVLLELHHK